MLSEFSHQPAHCYIISAAMRQPFAVRPRNPLWQIAFMWYGLTLRVLRKRCTQFIAGVMPTLNWDAV